MRGAEDSVGYEPPPRPRGPDDDVARLQRWEDDLARGERELRGQEGDEDR